MAGPSSEARAGARGRSGGPAHLPAGRRDRLPRARPGPCGTPRDGHPSRPLGDRQEPTSARPARLAPTAGIDGPTGTPSRPRRTSGSSPATPASIGGPASIGEAAGLPCSPRASAAVAASNLETLVPCTPSVGRPTGRRSTARHLTAAPPRGECSPQVRARPARSVGPATIRASPPPAGRRRPSPLRGRRPHTASASSPGSGSTRSRPATRRRRPSGRPSDDSRPTHRGGDGRPARPSRVRAHLSWRK